jgi:NADH dehydrogenase [ubiquinone] 1 alpha subcomplex assembly factor 7
MIIRASSLKIISSPSGTLAKLGVASLPKLLKDPRRCVNPLPARRCFANKTNRSSRTKQEDAKKKKFFSSPPVYGTPQTGLIMPSKNIVLDEGSMESNAQIVEKDQGVFPPLVDQGVQIGDNVGDTSSSFDKIDLSLSHSNTPSMIDLASMYDPKLHLPLKPNFSDPSKNYEVATPLGTELMKYIGVLGAPITLAEYMKRCLRDEHHGYYTNPPNDTDDFDDDNIENSSEGRGHRLIGQAGDFVTAPEISQIFGECLTIWLLTQYEALGKPSRIQLVELGPGRGTLMCDILRSASGIKGSGEEFVKALKGSSNSKDGQVCGVHFVEVSDNLRVTQREALENMQSTENTDKSLLNFGFVQWKTKSEKMKEMEQLMSKLRERKSSGEKVDAKTLSEIMVEQEKEKYMGSEASANNDSLAAIPIHWHDGFDSVPSQNDKDGSSIPTFIIGQEFLDALPVHVFQKSEHGWREHMIDVAIEEEDEDENKVEVQMRDGSVATTSAPVSTSKSSESNEKKKPRFRHVLSPGITPALRNLLHIDEDGNPVGTPSQVATLNEAPVGTVMEVCPESLALIQDIALRIEQCRGAALMIDYGNEGSRDSLRAFRKHEQVDVLSSPGTVDVTADVDFGALRNAVNHDLQATRSKMNDGEGVDSKNMPKAFGPATQGHFLASMGAVERTIKLIEDDNTTDDQADELCTALERLVSEEEMGERFKVLAITMKKDGIFAPPGF